MVDCKGWRWVALAVMMMFGASCSVATTSYGDNGGGALHELVGEFAMPDDGRVFLTGTDYGRAFDQLNFDLSQSCPLDRYTARIIEVDQAIGTGSRWPLQQGSTDPDELRAEFGLSLCEVTAAVEGFPGDGIYLSVTADPADVASAVETDPEWSGELTSRTTNEGMLYEWGDVSELQRRSTVRPLGRGGQLFVRDGLFVRFTDQDAAGQFLDPSVKRVGDLDGVPEIMNYLDDRGAATVALSNEPYTLESAIPSDEFIDEIGLQVALVEWRLVGFGGGRNDAGEQRVYLSLFHDTESAAQENVDRLAEIATAGRSYLSDQAWDELFTLESIEADGRYVYAEFSSPEPERPLYRLMLNVIIRQDALLVTES